MVTRDFPTLIYLLITCLLYSAILFALHTITGKFWGLTGRFRLEDFCITTLILKFNIKVVRKVFHFQKTILKSIYCKFKML